MPLTEEFPDEVVLEDLCRSPPGDVDLAPTKCSVNSLSSGLTVEVGSIACATLEECSFVLQVSAANLVQLVGPSLSCFSCTMVAFLDVWSFFGFLLGALVCG